MKIMLSTFGTRGDVQPFVALGQGLMAAGHEVIVCTPEGFRPFIEEHGLTYGYIANEFLRLTELTLQAQGLRAQMAASQQFPKAIRGALDDEWRVAQAFKPDLIVYHTKSLGSYHIAEKLGIPQMLTMPLPTTPTRAFPYPFFAGAKLGGALNRFTYTLMGLASAMWAGTTNDFRVKTLGLRPLSSFADPMVGPDRQPIPVLYPYSPHLVPVPPDFPEHVHVTGYWFLDDARTWEPDPALSRFLEEGPPPVYVGFGSMGGAQPEKRGQMAIEALGAAGQRGLLASGWGGLKAERLPEGMFLLHSAPHDALFPRMAAVVHHGGAGTTAAGLRAGKPSVICPFLGDQPFWGWAVHQAGVGPQPIPQNKLTAEKLAQSISIAVGDTAICERALVLRDKIRLEDGIGRAIQIIETVAA